MSINRRQFIILSAATAVGCQAGGGSSPGGENQPPVLTPVSIDAGPVSAYATDGVYGAWSNQGFFIVRHGSQLMAISSMCTHRRCRLRTAEDHTFYCRCHGSVFDPNGKVTEGPATIDLPVLPSSVDQNGHLIVHAVTG
jgi:Rieske Fe-S protein